MTVWQQLALAQFTHFLSVFCVRAVNFLLSGTRVESDRLKFECSISHRTDSGIRNLAGEV